MNRRQQLTLHRLSTPLVGALVFLGITLAAAAVPYVYGYPNLAIVAVILFGLLAVGCGVVQRAQYHDYGGLALLCTTVAIVACLWADNWRASVGGVVATLIGFLFGVQTERGNAADFRRKVLSAVMGQRQRNSP